MALILDFEDTANWFLIGEYNLEKTPPLSSIFPIEPITIDISTQDIFLVIADSDEYMDKSLIGWLDVQHKVGLSDGVYYASEQDWKRIYKHSPNLIFAKFTNSRKKIKFIPISTVNTMTLKIYVYTGIQDEDITVDLDEIQDRLLQIKAKTDLI